jgi:gliding motility-associated lipoprotein GldH
MRLVLLIPFAILVSCSQPPAHSVSRSFEDDLWTYTDSVIFEFDIEDTNALYDLQLTVVHHRDYGYQNVYTKVITSYPDASPVREEIISLELGSESGLWYGSCGGRHCTLDIPFQENVTFSSTGTYRIALYQHTRSDTLRGISRISFELWPT